MLTDPTSNPPPTHLGASPPSPPSPRHATLSPSLSPPRLEPPNSSPGSLAVLSRRQVCSPQFRADNVLALGHFAVTFALQLGVLWAYHQTTAMFWPCCAVQAGLELRWMMIFHDW